MQIGPERPHVPILYFNISYVYYFLSSTQFYQFFFYFVFFLGDFKNLTVCENDQLNIRCERSQRIAVYSVLYGRTTTNTPKCLTNGAIYAGIKLCILLLLQSNLYCVTLQGNIEIGSHKTGGC
jgi:hypothetical protein